jgi:ketosteroid isomerase-like protein
MENQTMQVTQEFVNAVQNVNLEKLGALLHPAVEWHQPGDNRFAGIKRSGQEVFQMVGGMFEVSQNTMALKEARFLGVNGDSAAYLLRWTAQRSGAALDVENIDVYTVAGGQVTGVKIYSGDIEQENVFWGK